MVGLQGSTRFRKYGIVIEEVCQSSSELLRPYGTDYFEGLWNHPSPWIEEPNYRRGGWSSVSRITLPNNADRTGQIAYLKRHENHTYRALHTFLSKAPTLEREFNNLRALEELGFTVPQPVYFGRRVHEGKLQAILLLKELPRFQSLSVYVKQCQDKGAKVSDAVIRAVAQETVRLHDCGWAHRCLYLKHVYVRESDDGSVDVALIDLESARKRLWMVERQRLRDLGSFYRRSRGCEVSR